MTADKPKQHTSLPRPAPWFELPPALSWIDLSAWLSGLSFALGVILVGQKAIGEEIQSGGFKLLIMAMACAIFFISVLIIQRYMRIALSSSTFGKPQELVSSGIFKYSRNPIYVAFLIPLLSIAVFSTTASLCALAFYVVTMHFTCIRKEERDLYNAFGEKFTTYAAKVPRWIF